VSGAEPRKKNGILDALRAQKARLVAANALSIWDSWGELSPPVSPGYAYVLS